MINIQFKRQSSSESFIYKCSLFLWYLELSYNWAKNQCHQKLSSIFLRYQNGTIQSKLTNSTRGTLLDKSVRIMISIEKNKWNKSIKTKCNAKQPKCRENHYVIWKRVQKLMWLNHCAKEQNHNISTNRHFHCIHFK